jgi:hypothetical protein
MRKSKYLVQALAVTLAATWGISQAQAAIETVTIGDGGLETFGLTWDGISESALAGGIALNNVSGPIPTFTSVCTDIGATVYLGADYDYSQPTVFNGQNGINPKWGAGNQGAVNSSANSVAAINAAADIYYNHQSVLTSGTTAEKAALQLAVWAALYDTTAGSKVSSITASTQRFYVTSGDSVAISDAALWLSQVNVNATYAGYLLIPDPVTQHGLQSQEMLYNITPVPEPTTLVAGALLLLPFGASAVRMLRKRQVA